MCYATEFVEIVTRSLDLWGFLRNLQTQSLYLKDSEGVSFVVVIYFFKVWVFKEVDSNIDE